MTFEFINYSSCHKAKVTSLAINQKLSHILIFFVVNSVMTVNIVSYLISKHF